jgi:hypothetical protein
MHYIMDGKDMKKKIGREGGRAIGDAHHTTTPAHIK